MSLPGAVLFACTQNRVRSPLAAALLRLRHGREIFVDSCGLKPADEVDPFSAVVADALGADLSTHRPKGFEAIDDGSFDLIVSLSPEAHHRALEFARNMACDVVYWPTFDPTLAEGSREQRLDAYRSVRDGLVRRIDAHFGRASTFGG
ncbi:low molecular weight phosphatase family protein [soil metagenome]